MSAQPFFPGDRVTTALRYPFTVPRRMKGKIHHVERCEPMKGARPGTTFSWRVWITGQSDTVTPDRGFAAEDFKLVARPRQRPLETA